MAFTTTAYKYIYLDDLNRPVIEGTSMKVVELVEATKAYQWGVDELLKNYPHLTVSKIYSALAYYWDHVVEIDAEITRRDEYTAQLQQATGESAFSQRLRVQGLLP